MNWEGIEGQKTCAKVPSQILYKGDQIKWGFNIPPDEKPLQWFKLLLLRDEDMEQEVRDSTYIKEAKEMLRKLNKSAENVIADYLGLLWKHVLKELKKTHGEGAVEGQPFRVVITFPAIWPLYAQSRMRQAAATAGILDQRHGGETKLHLCPEPEAAALAVMDDFDGHPVGVCYSISVDRRQI
jgi:molecular chaperone DnaK (HSP70)